MYEKHLGIQRTPDGSGATFEWRDAEDAQKTGMTVWSIFPHYTKYFDPSRSSFMLNYRVDDLDGLLKLPYFMNHEGREVTQRIQF